jgi:hypothetical protein
MAVVISEFEVVDTAPPAPRSPGADAAPAPGTPALPDPEDLRRLLAQCAEQQLRRFSH